MLLQLRFQSIFLFLDVLWRQRIGGNSIVKKPGIAAFRIISTVTKDGTSKIKKESSRTVHLLNP